MEKEKERKWIIWNNFGNETRGEAEVEKGKKKKKDLSKEDWSSNSFISSDFR